VKGLRETQLRRREESPLRRNGQPWKFRLGKEMPSTKSNSSNTANQSQKGDLSNKSFALNREGGRGKNGKNETSTFHSNDGSEMPYAHLFRRAG
jgi:hypothetical protein